MEKTLYYVYLLINNKTNTPVYAGITSNIKLRFQAHLKSKRFSGYDLSIVPVSASDDKIDTHRLEKCAIKIASYLYGDSVLNKSSLFLEIQKELEVQKYCIDSESEKTHLERRADLALKLKAKYAKTKNKTDNSKRVAALVGVSVMTVFNYMDGRIKDGYLAEEILRVW